VQISQSNYFSLGQTIFTDIVAKWRILPILTLYTPTWNNIFLL